MADKLSSMTPEERAADCTTSRACRRALEGDTGLLDAQIAAVVAAAEAEVAASYRARLSALDCRQVGDVGEVSGSHCLDGMPCLRCRYERLLDGKEVGGG